MIGYHRLRQWCIETGDLQASGIILDVWARAGHVPKDILRQELDRERFDAQGRTQVLLAQGVDLLQRGLAEEAVSVLKSAVDIVSNTGVNNAYSIPSLTWYATALRKYAEGFTAQQFLSRQRALKKAQAAARKAVRAARICKNDLPHALRELALLLTMVGHSRQARRKFESIWTSPELR